MKVFRVVKRPLCLGTGDPPPEWTYEVAAESRSWVQFILDRSGIDQTGVKIHDVTGKPLTSFAEFLHKKRRP